MKKCLLALLCALCVLAVPLRDAAWAAEYGDVSDSDWYAEAVRYVSENGIMTGTGSCFEPDDTATRAMLWTILARLDGQDVTTNDDEAWYAAARYWSIHAGVSDGSDPGGIITREQLAAMLYRFAQRMGVDVTVSADTDIRGYSDAESVSPWADEAMRWACGAGIIQGIDGALAPQSSASRAQVAAMLMRFCELLEAQRTYTVTFVYADGTSETVKVKAGEQVVSPAVASRIGYTFAGWYTAAQGGTPFRFNSTVDGDMVLYAHWNVYVPVVYAPVCQHTNLTYTDNEDGTHKVVCRDCEEVVDEAAEHMSSDESEGLCTCACGYRYDGWDGTAATEEELLAAVTDYVYSKNEETGEETIGRQFNISSPELLAAYAVYVNAGNCQQTDKVVLTENIDLRNRNWTPIGTTEHPFAARTFDGQNHIISNLQLNGGAANPTDLHAANQGLFGVTYTNGNIVEIMNLNIHNANIYAMNSAGALIGCLDTAQSAYWLAGYTGVHDIKLTGKVTIEGGNSGGISGSPVSHWALQTGFSRITIDVKAGSYLSNVKAYECSSYSDGMGNFVRPGGALGGVVAVAAWDRGSTDITSNLDVIGVAGNVGGIVGIGNQVWYQINYTGDVTVKGVTPSENGKYNYGLAVGGFAPVWHHYDMSAEKRATVSATGTLTLELTTGETIHTNGQTSDAIGGFFW